ncbi:MAG: hypothetical protein KJ955_05840 [Nanoarchaeota archaeon]|nr:hypothetical protein [Nanoarchaeota archaeon]
MIEAVNNYLQERFGFCAEKSTLLQHSEEGWENFAREQCPGADGVYLVRDMSANVKADSPIDVFHEYFGHGLYIEHSLPGKELYSLERRLLKEEEEAGIQTRDELDAFHGQSSTCRQIEELEKRNIASYEGVALWMEWYLSMLTDNMQSYEKRFNAMHENKQRLCSDFIEFSKSNTDYALLYANRFPKYYDNSILNEIVRNVFKDDINSIDFAVAYGSGKPYSDIDMFIVSDVVPSFFTGWLDVYSVSHEMFNGLLSKLDISVTDALFSGKIVYGDETSFENAKRKAADALVSPEAISFHQMHLGKAKALSEKCDDSSKKRSAARYAVSYALNAVEMKEGRKPMTLRALMARYPEEFSAFEKRNNYIS